MSDKVYYRQGSWLVTSDRFSSKYRDYALAEIRAIEVSRLPLVATLGGSLAAGAATVALSPLLFAHEIGAVACVAVLLTTVTWNCAWLVVKGDAWRGETSRIFAFWPQAQAVRAAINQALAERTHRKDQLEVRDTDAGGRS